MMERKYVIAIVFAVAFFAPCCGGFTSPKLAPLLDDPFYQARTEDEINAAVNYDRCIVYIDNEHSPFTKWARTGLLPKFVDALLEKPGHSDVALVRFSLWSKVSTGKVLKEVNYSKEGTLAFYRDGKLVHTEHHLFGTTSRRFVRLTENHLFTLNRTN